MTVVKFKETVFRVLLIFLKKKNNKKKNKTKKQQQKNKKQTYKKKQKTKKTKKQQQQHFSKHINIKTEMNLCSGKTAKLKDLFPTERDCGLNAHV